MTDQTQWWRKTTIYQIYPRSYMDSNGDGIGDLEGIISKLDYIKDLGFETIWLSPFFSSPQQDWGYDISDYLAVAPEYGHLEDVERLIEETHARGMRIIFDLVLNHTSDQHPWFQASSRGKQDPKRDWYIWRDGKGSRPPNNWASIVGGSAWYFDDSSEQWYYASFLPFQPDLNFRNPEVIEAMLAVARHWLDLGVDGYRLDIFHRLFKDKYFRDNPRSATLFSREYQAGFFQDYLHNMNLPETIQFAYQLRLLADSYSSPKLLLGEIFADHHTIKEYMGQNLEGLNLVFLWNLLNSPPDAGCLGNVLRQNENDFAQPYTPVLVFGNHDNQRLLSRIGGDMRIAMLLAVLQFTARGVPVTYYGEEIGMSELNLPKKEWKDPVGMRLSWLPGFVSRAMKISATRDGCRSPMQWEPANNAGFTSPDTKPWLPVNTDYQRVNVSSQAAKPDSLWNAYRQLVHLRSEHTALHAGNLEVIARERDKQSLLAYCRISDSQKILILLNFGGKQVSFLNKTGCQHEVFSAGGISQDQSDTIQIGPYSAAIFLNY